MIDMKSRDRLILSSSVGRFYFYPGTTLSHAKLVRDMVMKQKLAPNTSLAPRFKRPADAYSFVRSHGDIVSTVPFVWDMVPSSERR